MDGWDHMEELKKVSIKERRVIKHCRIDKSFIQPLQCRVKDTALARELPDWLESMK